MPKHLDEARLNAIKALKGILDEQPSIERAVLIDDLFGRIRIVLWAPVEHSEAQIRLVRERMSEAAGAFWSDEIWYASGASDVDKLVYDRAWDEGFSIHARFRLSDRVRNRTAWFKPIGNPPWSATDDPTGPPIVVFYSFKGGVGRTTALASFAIQRARAGDRVAVLDLDLDAPGVGTLLAADEFGTTASWGIVDYLLEQSIENLDLRDYYHACRRSVVTGSGEILVLPAGDLSPERDYLTKLARLDLDPIPGKDGKSPLEVLLKHVRDELDPKWILIDARAGLSEPAGVLLSGIAHLHVLFGTSSEQSWRGLRPVLERIGASRVRDDRPQLDLILVHAMVPQDIETASIATQAFMGRSLAEFRDHYYAIDPEDPDEDRLWYIRDSEASDAPHAAVPISYQSQLAHFNRIDDVADDLAETKPYRELANRIAQRFENEEK
jgi:cellulose biosynthesis protein BcsQ